MKSKGGLAERAIRRVAEMLGLAGARREDAVPAEVERLRTTALEQAGSAIKAWHGITRVARALGMETLGGVDVEIVVGKAARLAGDRNRMHRRAQRAEGRIARLERGLAKKDAKITEQRLRAEEMRADHDGRLERLTDLLERTAIGLRGPEPELVMWSWHDLPERAEALRARAAEMLPTPLTARPRSAWNEEDGPVLWWAWPVSEPPYAGTPLDDDFPEYVTHWTPIQVPVHVEGEGEVRGG